MKRRLFPLLTMLLLLLTVRALADDVYSIADPATGGVTTECSYINMDIPVPGEAAVVLTIYGPDGQCVYQRDYGLCPSSFRTEDIYLRLDGSQTVYQVNLAVGETVYAFPVTRITGRLTGNAACTVGYPLSSLSGADTWRTATLIDVGALEGASITVPIHASDAYTLGSATLSVSGGCLTVSAWVDGGIDGSIDSATVYVATNALTAQALGTRRFTGLTGGLDSPIDLSGATYAAVYVKMTVSFDPTGVPGSPDTYLHGQDDLWQHMLTETANEAVG